MRGVLQLAAGESPITHAAKRAVAKRAAAQITGLCVRHRAVVQAGGHIGLWPLALSTYFGAVYTFEPDAENFRCLARNATLPNVFPARGALGESPQGVRLERDVPKSGHWFTVPGGPIPTYRIDDLGLAFDAIVLDVEGAELDALRGAARALAHSHPLVWCEARDAARQDAIAAWLAPYGYGVAMPGMKRDVYFRVTA